MPTPVVPCRQQPCQQPLLPASEARRRCCQRWFAAPVAMVLVQTTDSNRRYRFSRGNPSCLAGAARRSRPRDELACRPGRGPRHRRSRRSRGRGRPFPASDDVPESRADALVRRLGRPGVAVVAHAPGQVVGLADVDPDEDTVVVGEGEPVHAGASRHALDDQLELRGIGLGRASGGNEGLDLVKGASATEGISSSSRMASLISRRRWLNSSSRWHVSEIDALDLLTTLSVRASPTRSRRGAALTSRRRDRAPHHAAGCRPDAQQHAFKTSCNRRYTCKGRRARPCVRTAPASRRSYDGPRSPE
jgi:hypothetical protein